MSDAAEALAHTASQLLTKNRPSQPGDHEGWLGYPSAFEIDSLVQALCRVLFFDYFAATSPTSTHAQLHSALTDLHTRVADCIARCSRHAAHLCDGQGPQACALTFLGHLSTLRDALMLDAHAALAGDPAAADIDEVVTSYPGFFALTVYRLAHQLKRMQVRLLPRMMTEAAHSRTGIDLHPSSLIGPHAFIDHGTGVVVGETCIIGPHVRIYQGVTLGALSLPRQVVRGADAPPAKRHPTIGEGVTLYANATVLGGDTVVGDFSVIGGSVFLTHSVPPHSRVSLANQQLRVQGKSQAAVHVDVDFQI